MKALRAPQQRKIRRSHQEEIDRHIGQFHRRGVGITSRMKCDFKLMHFLVLLYDFNEGPQKPQRGGMCVAQGVSPGIV
ncbi:MAG: hypothetical protein GY801_06210, partial [bacterium]|nr:hypothetical protein [bacterium]